MKLLSTVPFHEEQLQRLAEIAPDLDMRLEVGARGEGLRPFVEADTEIIYAFGAPGNVVEYAPGLRWVQLLSAGCDYLAGSALMKSPVVVTTCSGLHATPIAEHVMSGILALYRGLPRTFRAQVEKRWLGQDDFSRITHEFRGRTVGIIGYGSIGREVARLSKPFGTRILAMKRDAGDVAERGYAFPDVGDLEGSIPDRIYAPNELHEMLAECDVVVLAMPLTDETRHMLGRREFEAMKPGSFIVNIARGAVMDEAALIEALKNGKPVGVALDVFETEPLPQDSELWDLENVIVTPHIAGASRPYLRRAFEVFAENLGRYVREEPLLNLVNRDLGY